MDNSTLSMMGAVTNVLNMTDNANGTDFWNMTDFENMTTAMTTSKATPYRPNAWLLDGTRKFTRVYRYLSYTVGIPGNFLTFLILIRMKPFTSVQVWLTGLSVIDLVIMVFRCIFIESQVSYAGNIIWYPTTATCILEYIMTWTAEYCNYMFFLAMSVERFIAVWFPLRMSSLTKPLYAAVGIASIVFVVVLIQCHHFWTIFASGTGCFIKREHRDFWKFIWIDTVEAWVFRAIPLLGVVLLNILIVVRLALNRRNIKTALSEDQIKEKQKQQRQINRLLSAATAFFFVSVMPDIIFRLTGKYWGDIWTDWVALRNYWIVMNVSAVLRVGNHAGNFIFYILVAKRFRNELFYLLTCGNKGEHNGVKGKIGTGGKIISK